MAIEDRDRIFPRIWQGGRPDAETEEQRWAPYNAGFDVVVFCAKEWQPAPDVFPNVRVFHAFLDDSGERPPSAKELRDANETARRIALLHLRGARLLITCQQGLNRSGLVSALTIRNLTGSSGHWARNEVQKRRRAKHIYGVLAFPLFNADFVDYLDSLPPKTPLSASAQPLRGARDWATNGDTDRRNVHAGSTQRGKSFVHADPILRRRAHGFPTIDLRLDGEEDHVPLARLEHRASEQIEEVFVGEVRVHGGARFARQGLVVCGLGFGSSHSTLSRITFLDALRNRGARNCPIPPRENACSHEKSVGLLRACRLCLRLFGSHAYRPCVAREMKMMLWMAMAPKMATSTVTPLPRPTTIPLPHLSLVPLQGVSPLVAGDVGGAKLPLR